MTTPPVNPTSITIYDDKSGGLQVVEAANAVETWYSPVAADDGGNLFVYENGVWNRRDAERTITRRLVEILGNRFRTQHVSNVLALFKARPPLIQDDAPQTQFLNLPNGLLDWRTGDLHPHTPDVPSTVRIPVEWNPDATCPAVRSWFSEVFPEDCIPLVEEIIGACLIDENPVHKAIMIFGTGRNGKGTFIRLLTKLIGRDNVCSVNPQTLDANRFNSSELYGKLANLAGDVDSRTFRVTEMFKQVTGGDRLKGERKYGQPFYFTSHATLIAAYNENPSTADDSEGFFSRWVVLPMPNYFGGQRMDASVEDRIGTEAELQGLLVAGVNGLRRLKDSGRYTLGESSLKALDSYREAVDPVLGWLREEQERLVATRTHTRAALYTSFKQWCEDGGVRPVPSNRKLYERLNSAGTETDMHIYPWRTSGSRGYEFTPSWEARF